MTATPELAAVLVERDDLLDLVRALRAATANPRITRKEILSAIDLALDEGKPGTVAEVLRRFDAGRTRGPIPPRPRARRTVGS